MTDTQTTPIMKEQFASDIFWPNFTRDAKIDKRIVALYFSNIPSHWIPLLWPFETSSPEKYYAEETYQLVSTLLVDAYDADMGYYEQCLSYFANELDAAYANYRRVTQFIYGLPTPQIGRERRFRQYIFPLYQELIEAVWRPLARFCIIALEKPPDSEFAKYAKFLINDLENKLENRHSKFELLLGVHRVLRNNIAHYKFEFSDDVMKQHGVVLHDPNEEDISDDEIDDLLIELYDCCSAMLYGILRHSAIHEHQFTAIPFGHYIREQIIAHAIQEKRIVLEKSTFVETQGLHQRNIEIRYYYPPDARVLMLLLSALKLVVRFLPSDEYFIMIKPRKGAQYIWIQTPHNRAQAFVENRLSLYDYLKTRDVRMFKDCTRPPKVPAILRFSAFFFPNMIHVLRNGWRYIRGWSLIKEEPFSTGTQARYRLYLVQHRDLSQEEATRIIKKVIRRKRALVKSVMLALWDILRSFVVKRTPARPPVTVILVTLWRKEKRISQMAFDPRQGHERCVCCAEWKQAPPFLWLHPTDSDEKTENFVLRWFG